MKPTEYYNYSRKPRSAWWLPLVVVLVLTPIVSSFRSCHHAPEETSVGRLSATRRSRAGTPFWRTGRSIPFSIGNTRESSTSSRSGSRRRTWRPFPVRR